MKSIEAPRSPFSSAETSEDIFGSSVGVSFPEAPVGAGLGGLAGRDSRPSSIFENIMRPTAIGSTPVGSTCASDGRVKKASDPRGFGGTVGIRAAYRNEAVAKMKSGA